MVVGQPSGKRRVGACMVRYKDELCPPHSVRQQRRALEPLVSSVTGCLLNHEGIYSRSQAVMHTPAPGIQVEF